jgi:phosphatidylserine/phosphatidylglycerophosphate/cardiolipin synthase-like enzyme
MSSPKKHIASDWWAEGDTPVRHHTTRVSYFIDGRFTMFSLCCHFLMARKYIYLADWGMTPSIKLVRGKDHRAGPDGSPEQEALLEDLRAEGLQEADIAFWSTHELTLQEVLGYAVSKGVEVKLLLWDCLPLPFTTFYHPDDVHDQLEQVGVTCVLDDSSRGVLHHPMESLHQKLAIVDGTHAFVGGVDLMTALDDDYDRWDTPSHPFDSPLRSARKEGATHSWHDAHTLIEGTAVEDVELNFRQRWNDVVHRHNRKHTLLIPEHSPTPSVESKSLVQVARTIPEHTYTFDPDPGIQDITQLYAKAFRNAQDFIYLENQYFWLHSYLGLDIPILSIDSPDMEQHVRELGDALKRGVMVAIVLPDHPDPGRAFTDEALRRLRSESPDSLADGHLQVFCLGSSGRKEAGEEYLSVYVHAKLAIVDDVWATAGSANLNNRGMRDDTEMNVATLDPEVATGLRLMLWAEHLGLVHDDDLLRFARYLGRQHQRHADHKRAKEISHSLHKKLGDPLVGLQLLRAQAWDNLNRYKAKQPLIGHLLPYFLQEEAEQQGLPFDEEGGWLDKKCD